MLGSDFVSLYSFHTGFCNDGDGGRMSVSSTPLRYFLCDPINWPDLLLVNF